MTGKQNWFANTKQHFLPFLKKSSAREVTRKPPQLRAALGMPLLDTIPKGHRRKGAARRCTNSKWLSGCSAGLISVFNQLLVKSSLTQSFPIPQAQGTGRQWKISSRLLLYSPTTSQSPGRRAGHAPCSHWFFWKPSSTHLAEFRTLVWEDETRCVWRGSQTSLLP